LARVGPLILVEGDNLVLRRGDQRIEARFTPDLYDVVKTFSHIPLALDVMLATAEVDDGEGGGGRLAAGRGDALRGYRGPVQAARESLPRLGLERPQAEREAEIITASLGVIDSAIEARACSAAARRAYTRRMSPLVLANAADAARAELDALHRLVNTWREG